MIIVIFFSLLQGNLEFVTTLKVMEVKKNPEVNVSRNSSLYFAIGLNLTLLSTYLILEYKSYKKEDVILEALDLDDYLDEDIENINLSIPTPPPTTTIAVVPERY
jgi:protein TonB